MMRVMAMRTKAAVAAEPSPLVQGLFQRIQHEARLRCLTTRQPTIRRAWA